MMVRGFEMIQQQAAEVAKSEKAQAVATTVAPRIVDAVVTRLSGNPAMGSAADAASSAAAKVSGQALTEFAVGAGLVVGYQLAALALVPIGAGVLLYNGAKKGFRGE